MAADSISHRLPMELVLHIVDLAAASSRHSCLDLSLVASWARDIASPHLYQTVTLDSLKSLSGLKEMIASNNNSHRTTKHLPAAPLIRDLWVASSSPYDRDGKQVWEDLDFVFRTCDSVRELVLNAATFRVFMLYAISPLWTRRDVKALPQIVPNQELQLTSVDHSGFYSLARGLAEKYTRIRVADPQSHKVKPQIHNISRLSHFSVPYYDMSVHEPGHLTRLLDRKGFKLLVIEVMETMEPPERTKLEEWVRDRRQSDKRVCLLHSPSYASGFMERWETEKRSGESFWERATRYTVEWESTRPQQ